MWGSNERKRGNDHSKNKASKIEGRPVAISLITEANLEGEKHIGFSKKKKKKGEWGVV